MWPSQKNIDIKVTKQDFPYNRKIVFHCISEHFILPASVGMGIRQHLCHSRVLVLDLAGTVYFLQSNIMVLCFVSVNSADNMLFF